MKGYVNPENLSAILDSLKASADTTVVSATSQYHIPNSSPPSFALMMFQMLLVLLLISAVLYLFLYLFRKVNYTHKLFKVHEIIYLSQKQGLAAVSFGKKLYIIGFSQNSVNAIDTIDDPEILAQVSGETVTNSKFIDQLKNYFNKGKL